MLWSQDVLALNPNPEVTVEVVGQGKRKVILVDGFYRYPEKVLALAEGLHFFGGAMHGNFPGTRAMITLDTSHLVDSMSQLWGSSLKPAQGDYQPVLLSAIVNRGQQLNNAQRQPHIDPGISAMVYLNRQDECRGGTGIYRHELTGLERVPPRVTQGVLDFAAQFNFTPDQLQTPEDYQRFQDAIIFNPEFAMKENSYINAGNEFWGLLYLIEMKFNRLVIFDGRMPHSQYLKEGFEDHRRLNQVLYLKERE